MSLSRSPALFSRVYQAMPDGPSRLTALSFYRSPSGTQPSQLSQPSPAPRRYPVAFSRARFRPLVCPRSPPRPLVLSPPRRLPSLSSGSSPSPLSLAPAPAFVPVPALAPALALALAPAPPRTLCRAFGRPLPPLSPSAYADLAVFAGLQPPPRPSPQPLAPSPRVGRPFVHLQRRRITHAFGRPLALPPSELDELAVWAGFKPLPPSPQPLVPRRQPNRFADLRSLAPRSSPAPAPPARPTPRSLGLPVSPSTPLATPSAPVFPSPPPRQSTPSWLQCSPESLNPLWFDGFGWPGWESTVTLSEDSFTTLPGQRAARCPPSPPEDPSYLMPGSFVTPSEPPASAPRTQETVSTILSGLGSSVADATSSLTQRALSAVGTFVVRVKRLIGGSYTV